MPGLTSACSSHLSDLPGELLRHRMLIYKEKPLCNLQSSSVLVLEARMTMAGRRGRIVGDDCGLL